MRLILSVLGPPALLAVVVLLVRGADVDTGGSPPPPPDAAREPVEDRLPERPPADPAVAAPAGAAAGREGNVRCGPPSPPEGAPGPGHVLLGRLRQAAASEAATFPMECVREVAALLTEQPETADLFLDAVEEGDLRLMAYLKHAFFLVRDEPLRARLLEGFASRDRGSREIEATLSDVGLVLASLRDPSGSRQKLLLINRLGDPLLRDPDVRETLILLAETDRDPNVRKRAISRLGRPNLPENRDLLISILKDVSRELSDRQAAARMLSRAPDDDTVGEFVGILRRGSAAPLMRFAAKGLRTSAERPEATSTLTELFLEDGADLQARKFAASSLAQCLRSLDVMRRNALGTRVMGALDDLSRREDEVSSSLLVFAMGVLSTQAGGGYGGDVRSFYEHCPSQELKEQMRADPVLRRALEIER